MRALAVLNGRITTFDPQRPEAEALLAVDGHVELVGSTADVRAAASRLPNVEMLDLAGRRAVPGFTDSHIHFVNYGLNLERVDRSTLPRSPLTRPGVAACARRAAPQRRTHDLAQHRRSLSCKGHRRHV